MKKKTSRRVLTASLTLLLTLVILFSSAVMSFGQGITPTDAEYIKQISSLQTGFENYLNSAVMFELPASVRDTDEISVIIQMDKPSLLDSYEQTDKSTAFTDYSISSEAAEMKSENLQRRNEILASLDKRGIDYAVGSSYSAIFAGFEIVIKAGDFKETCSLLGSKENAIVGEVYNVAETKLVENKVNFYENTGIFNSSDFKYDGTGMVVAVLDTGLDYTHSAFSVNNFTADRNKLGLTRAQVNALLHKTEAGKLVSGLKVDDVYVNDKVPFSFDYADRDSDVYSLHNNHGTHVSGVIVGKDDTITGVAPNAQLVSMKIFSDTEESARTSWILAALEDCVVLGVDVINMSLGTACGFSREMDKEAVSGVYDRIRATGISLVVAASNSYNSAYASDKNGNLGLTSNPDTSTVGSPSTYKGALSVASINGEKTPYILFGDKIIYFVEATNAASDEKDFFEELLGSKDSIDMEYVLVPGAGRPADYTGMEDVVKGKIVLVRRGSTTFEEKATAAFDKGAAGIIIYNNVAGDIKMNAGTVTIPICSISQDDGEMLAAQKSGVIKISRAQKSGPFMSDFSSWGPSPDLEIKPEITAHGGNILSAVTGGGYDRLSGTSMACPNMAGVIALMRQYVIEKFPEIANDEVEITALVNRLLMSTADVVYNKNGLPYAVRKQGAGLANLKSASTTTAYLITYDREDGSVMDKTKIELGDDPSKSGVYVLKFSVKNFGDASLSYDISASVMTEGVSDTKTHNGETTVTEEGYILSGASVVVSSVTGGSCEGTVLTVGAGETADVCVTVTLSDADKEYLNTSFENGMYVEGFVSLKAVFGTTVDLGAPYLAFYGDWTVAPLFDLDYFETNADELDDSIELLDKTLPDAYATRPIGGVSEDYVSYLGSYYFLQDPSDRIIAASRDYVALSNVEGSICSLRFVWAGLLRNAEKIVVTITDESTGEEIFRTVDYDVRKSYGDGGPIYPANVEIEFDVSEHNLKNNTKYLVKLEGYLDYGNGGLETNEKNTFEFPFTTDFQAPSITDCEFYTEYDKELKKDRLYARMAVYDNHYSMALQIGYVSKEIDPETNSNVFPTFESYLTPVYSERDSITYVEYELTDYIYEIKENALHKNTFAVACYDYALNTATYEIPLPTEFIDFYLEDSEIVLSPNQVYTINPLMYPDTEWPELLEYRSSNKSVAEIVNNKIIALAPGTALITIYDPRDGGTELFVPLKVLAEGEEGYKKYSKPVVDVFEVTGYETVKAYYYLSNADREIGQNGDVRFFKDLGYSLSMFPSESVALKYKIAAYFPDDTEIRFESNNSKIVSIDENGVIVANEKGSSSVSVKVYLDGKSTYYSQTIRITVKDPYIRTGPSLTHYFGNGGLVAVPESLLLTEIGAYAFSNFDYVPKDENDEISEEDPDFTKQVYIGENTITKVVIPEGVEKIGPYAFAGLTALEEVVLPSTLEAIEYGAFFGCTSLKKVSGIEHVKLINYAAFQGCNINGTLDLKGAHAIGDYAFANNSRLESVVLPETLRSIGEYAFAGDTKLSSVTIKAEKAKFGPYVFLACESLTSVKINAAVIPEGAFYGCKKLSSLTIGKDVSKIGSYALTGTALTSFTVENGNASYKIGSDNAYLLSADGTKLILAAPGVSGDVVIDDNKIKSVEEGAFSGNRQITSVSISGAVSVGEYAFADCTKLESVVLGQLTYIGDYAFFNTSLNDHPAFDSLSEIGAYAFAYTDITSVTVGDGVTVGEGAFCECIKLSSVSVGNNAVLEKGAFMLGKTREETYKVSFYIVNGVRYYYFEYLSPLTSLTIGNNVTIGDSAFFGAAKLTDVTLGEGSVIGSQAFFNAASLVNIDLSKALRIDALAFSGDIRYVYGDSNMNNMLIIDDSYVYHYYAPVFSSVSLDSIEYLGEQAFQYCRMLDSVKLGEKLKNIPYMAFANCDKLSNVVLYAENIGESAFAETGLLTVDLSTVKNIGKYAFVYCEDLTDVKFSSEAYDVEEGAFAYCSALASTENLGKAVNIDKYAFAYSALTEADLTAAVTIGDQAFLKESLTDFTVKLGADVKTIGDNPFAFCKLTPFSSVVKETFNGKEYSKTVYTFDLNENVKIIDGSLYCKVPSGYELIAYAGTDLKQASVAEGTVRITAFAFAGSDVVRVELPLSLNSIGHKAFFDCNKLSTVIFKSYEAPILEEEFDMLYHDSFENSPLTGEFSLQYTDGSSVTFTGLGIVPYYMWNIGPGQYSNMFYGANFVNYIGKTDSSLVMVRPSNALGYETFTFAQYFGTVIDGGAAPDENTLLAIEAINKIPGMVTLEHEAIVIAAREAYNRVTSREQQALVTNYNVLVSAEKRIEAFKTPAEEPEIPDIPTEEPKKDTSKTVLIVVVIIESVLIALGAAAAILYFTVFKNKLSQNGKVKDESVENTDSEAAQSNTAENAGEIQPDSVETDGTAEENSEEDNTQNNE